MTVTQTTTVTTENDGCVTVTTTTVTTVNQDQCAGKWARFMLRSLKLALTRKCFGLLGNHLKEIKGSKSLRSQRKRAAWSSLGKYCQEVKARTLQD